MRCTVTMLVRRLLTLVDYTPSQIVHRAVQHFAFWAELCQDVLRLDITVRTPLFMQTLHTLQYTVIFTGQVDSLALSAGVHTVSCWYHPLGKSVDGYDKS